MNSSDQHDPASCAGRGCPLHGPSGHHMRDWPIRPNAYRGYVERLCRHGVAHPDPDDVVHLQSIGGVSAAHECDGCCIAPLRPAR